MSTDGGWRAASANALRCLVHPLSIAALLVLAVNDHVGKGVGPGWLTGKVSDFAGLFYFPFLVTLLVAIVARPSDRLAPGRVAFWVVGVWFASAKTIPVVHDATVAHGGGRRITDQPAPDSPRRRNSSTTVP